MQVTDFQVIVSLMPWSSMSYVTQLPRGTAENLFHSCAGGSTIEGSIQPVWNHSLEQ